MADRLFHMTGLGSALIDVYAHVSEAELAALLAMAGAPETGQNAKGTMVAIDATQSRQLLDRLKPDIKAAGGATANSIFGMARMGLKTGFIGKIGRDALGELFAENMAAENIAFPTKVLMGDAQTGEATEAGKASEALTGHCIVLITPDAERTMFTLLGASATLAPADLDETLLGRSSYFFSEAYLFDSPTARQAFARASNIVRQAGGKIAFSLADPLCVARHKTHFTQLIASGIDILLANEAEAAAMFGGAQFAQTLAAIQASGINSVITRSEKGAVIIWDGQVIEIKAEPVADIIDLTGAGDQFAAGFLSGLAQGRDLAECGRRGAIAASEVIRHIGPRPQTDMNKLFAAAGL